MGILDDLKKFLFGAKAVAKSAADEALHHADAFGEAAKTKAEQVGERLREEGGEVAQKIADTAERVGVQVIEVSEKVGERIKESAEEIGGKILEKGTETLERAKTLGEQLREKASGLMEKAQEEAARADMEATVKAAEDLARKSATASGQQGSTAKDSLFEQHEDFFQKAAKFASGDYQSEVEITLKKDPGASAAEKPKGKVAGFTDHDGDGNEIIDDAILADEEDPS